MPDCDGTGPRGQGPLTGRGMGFCVLKIDPENPERVTGFAGLHNKPIKTRKKQRTRRRTASFVEVAEDKLRYGGQKGG